MLLYAAVSGSLAAAESSDDASEDFTSPVFFLIDPFVIPVIRNYEVAGHFHIVVQLELEPGNAHEEIVPYISRLRDALYEDLKIFVERRPDILFRVNLHKLKSIMRDATARVLGPDVVREVLIQHLAQRFL